jgi:DNA-binding transcriptional regulator YiaG
MAERTQEGSDSARWDSERVRRLRDHLDETQGALAERLGTRQQTVSEWETGSSNPRRMSRRLLHLVAEESGFYAAEPSTTTPDEASTDQ